MKKGHYALLLLIFSLLLLALCPVALFVAGCGGGSDDGGGGGGGGGGGQSYKGFIAVQQFPAGDAPWSTAIGDLNGDNKPDLAVANRSDNNVSVLLQR